MGVQTFNSRIAEGAATELHTHTHTHTHTTHTHTTHLRNGYFMKMTISPFSMQLWLDWKSLCSPALPQMHRALPLKYQG